MPNAFNLKIFGLPSPARGWGTMGRCWLRRNIGLRGERTAEDGQRFFYWMSECRSDTSWAWDTSWLPTRQTQTAGSRLPMVRNWAGV